LHGATATLLLTLSARAAADKVVPDAVFSDPLARQIAAELPVDVSGYARDPAFVRGIVRRAALFDRLATEFFQTYPNGMGVTLGAGLCTRRSRILAGLSPHQSIDWLNIDLPEAIRLREQYMGAATAERNLACSVLDLTWLESAGLQPGRPVLFLMEGVCPYLPKAPLEALLQRLAEHLEQHGGVGQMVLDYVHPDLAHLPMQVGGMQLPVVSGFDSAEEISQLHGAIQVLSEEHPFSSFSPQHRHFESAFRAVRRRWPYTVLRLGLGGKDHG
jgi:O-methyltransferase involved in polyketide biosynthesis